MSATIIKLPVKKGKQPSTKPLTALKVKNHKSGFLADASPHKGLRLRANKNGTKTWIYRYRSGDKLKQIKLGSYPAIELAEARSLLAKQRKLIEQNLDPQMVAEQKKELAKQLLKASEKGKFTFGVMVEKYLTERIEKDRKPKGAIEVRRLLENDLGDLTNFPVCEIEPNDIHEHILTIAKRAPNTARVFRSELTRAWKYAINTGQTKAGCPINTDMGGKLIQGKRERFLSDDELKMLIPWLPHYSRTVEDILTLTLYLGIRSGEVCKLRDEWLAKESTGWWITIPAEFMKKKHSDHRIPLSGTVLKIINRRKGSGFWFPARIGGHIKQKVLGVEVYSKSGASDAPIYKHLPVCPVSQWAPNDLRKTARTILAAIKCPYEVGETIIHHKLSGVGGLYNQYNYDAEKQEWLPKLGKYLDALASTHIEN